MKKYIMGSIAAIMAISLVAFSPVTKKQPASKHAVKLINYSFRYNNDVLAGAKNAANYTQITNNPPSCTGAQEIPCRLNFTSSDTNPVNALTTHLAGFADEQAVATSAAEKKPSL